MGNALHMPGLGFAKTRYSLSSPKMPSVPKMPSNRPRQRRSERILAESEAAHAYLDLALEARNDLVGMLNLERAFRSFGTITRAIARGRLDPTLQAEIVAAQLGLQERLYNVAYAVVED